MKRILSILFVLSIQLIYGQQQQDLQRANRLFDKTYYSTAIPLYEKVSANNQSAEVIQNLGDCYYYTNEYDKAQAQYSLLMKNTRKDLKDEYYFRYAQTLKAAGKYTEANKLMRNYL